MEKERRVQTREKTNMPILYAKNHDDSYHSAMMYNISLDGLNFESDHMFSQGEYLFVKTNDPFLGFEPVKPCYASVVQVKWCRKKNIHSRYKIGVKQVSIAKAVDKEDIDTSSVCCEICKSTFAPEIVKTDEGLYLCLSCFTSMS